MALTPQQVHFFRDEGYLIVPDLFDPNELEPLRGEMHAFIGGAIEQLAREAKLTNRHADLSDLADLDCLRT